MSIGTRIIQVRNQKGLTQRHLSERTGIANSYLSRIENRRLEPRPKTLRKIADALGVPLSVLFEESPARGDVPNCVVSMSGQCILEMLRSKRHRRRRTGPEAYSQHQLQLLREANYLIQTGDKRLLQTLEIVLGALLNTTSSRRETKRSPFVRLK